MGLPATVNLGRYELLSELGRGGMAELFVGRLRGIGGFAKLVAIKRILPQLAQDPTFVDLFLNEGRIASRLSHPNLCQVFELGEADGGLYLAMEYLEGVTWEVLARALPEDPALVLRAVAGVMAQACDGLHYAHALRDARDTPSPVIHRDISPQNLFVTVDGVCKILDFGVAKMTNDVRATRSGMLKGKLPYMSPEQIRGEPLDGRSDTFALGVVAWEGLVRRELFLRETEFQIWKAILEEEPPAVSSRASAYGAEVDAVVMRALARDREARYGSIRELGEALRAVAEPYGGALTTHELAALVKTHCAEPLAARSRAIATIVEQSAVREARPARSPSGRRAATTKVESGGAVMALRDESLVVQEDQPRPRRRGRALALVLASALVGFVVVWFAIRSTTPREAEATTASAVPAPASTPATTPASGPGSASTPAPMLEATPAPSPPPPVRTKASRPAPPRPTSPPRPTPSEPAAAPATAPGTLSVDVRLGGRVYIDGAFVDETPIYRRALAPGAHELRVVRSDGAERTRTIHIESGRALNLGTLAW